MNDKKNIYRALVSIYIIIFLVFFAYTTYHCIRYRDIFEGDYPEVYFAIFICILCVVGLASNIMDISKINNESNPDVPQTLIQYKELLDKEIINKEEFEKKKKQLLKL